jgi:NitT/TauT family transport system substrate-binding protein
MLVVIRLFIAALFFVTVLPTPVPAQAPRTTIRIQDYPGIGNLLFRVAASKGFCEKQGLICELKIIATGPLGATALLSRSIEVGFFPAEVQISAMIAGAKLKAILSGAQLNPFILIARSDLDLDPIGGDFRGLMTQLKGRRIGVPARGGSGELQFGLLATLAGLQPNDFTFVAVGAPNTSYGALTSKQIDVSVAYEPSGSICDVLKTCRILFDFSKATDPVEIAATNGGVTNAVVTEEMIANSPQIVASIIAAARDAELFLQDPRNYNEALAIAKSFFSFDLPSGDKIMETSFQRTIPTLKVAIDRRSLQQIAANMLAMKQISEPFDSSRLVYDKAP